MPIKIPNASRAMAMDGFSTKMAADRLAAETRAFGNKAAQLKLKMATDAFSKAKDALLQGVENGNSVTQKSK